MRFIIHEQPYEKVVAAGELRYERDGVATGAVEKWRLTTAVANYHFLRIDLDARSAPSGQSTLYHLVLNENGRPERLRFRQWSGEHKITGNLLFEAGVIIASHEMDSESSAEELAVTEDFGFWLPSSVGLSLLTRELVTTAVSLRPTRSKQHSAFSLFQTEIRLNWDDDEEIMVMGRAHKSRPFIIQWADQQYTLWLDDQNCVLKMTGGNRVTAVATRLIHYK
jgi:hypothetical protein